MDDRALLTPGSVWIRERKGKPAITSTVICVTNTHLPEDKKQEHPEMVENMPRLS